MIKELIKIANELDSRGLAKEADMLDKTITRVAQTTRDADDSNNPNPKYVDRDERPGFEDEGVAGPNQYPSNSDMEQAEAEGKKCYWFYGGSFSIDVYENDCLATRENFNHLGINGKLLFTIWHDFYHNVKDLMRSDEDWDRLEEEIAEAIRAGDSSYVSAAEKSYREARKRLKDEYGAEDWMISGLRGPTGSVSAMIESASHWIQKVLE